jgi:predicted DNA-binding protein
VGRVRPNALQVRVSDAGLERMRALATECGVPVATVCREALAAGIGPAEVKLRAELVARRAGWDHTAPLQQIHPNGGHSGE